MGGYGRIQSVVETLTIEYRNPFLDVGMNNRTLASAFAILVSAAATGCGDKGPSAAVVVDPPAIDAPALLGTLVSNPLRPQLSASSSGSGVSLSISGETFAYASAAPGTFPDAVSASIRNTTQNRAAQSVPVINGGFDPIAVAATSGDELSLTFTGKDGGGRTFVVKVPPRKPPQVVRTSPAKGRIDVAMSVQIMIVFSEPVDPSTLTPASISFRRGGEEIPATIVISPDRLSVEVVPGSPLDAATSYEVDIKETIRDLDGDALANPSTVDFTTNLTTAQASLIFTYKAGGNIYSINADGTDWRQLTSTANRDVRGSWSPDGRRIAFARNFPGNENRGFGTSDIFIMNADGSNPVRRTTGAFFWSAAWSPDGKKLLLSDEEVYVAHIYIMSADDDGTSATLLMSDGRSPKWSPDGSKIVYVHTSGDDGYHQIYVMDADGRNEHPLTEIDPGGIQGVTWSPDGSRIAFSKCLAGSCNIYLMNRDGSDLHLLADVGDAGDVTWSPDGKWIAFSADDYFNFQWNPSVKYIPSTGGTPRVVITGAYHPSWRR